MTPQQFDHWTNIFKAKARELYPSSDPAHDYLHIDRVVGTALKLAEEEKADIYVVMPAAYFHDFVNVPKNDPRRTQASRLSADAAVEYLKTLDYPSQYFDAIKHAIAAHSFSANIPCETIEAKVVQDADRLDSLGAIGVVRCFATSVIMQRPFYHLEDPWADDRELDDKNYGIDHFPIKLYKLPSMLHTKSARFEAEKRLKFMKIYMDQLRSEI